MADPPKEIDPGIAKSKKWFIRSTPDLTSVTPGAVVTYECATLQKYPPKGVNVRWFIFPERALFAGGDFQHLVRGSQEYAWKYKWALKPGKYIVGCGRHEKPPEWCFLSQYVQDKGAAIARLMGQARKGTLVHPDEAPRMTGKQIENYKLALQKFPIPASQDDLREYHNKRVKQMEEYLKGIQAKLQETKGWIRYPFLATYLGTESQEKVQLNVFLARPRKQQGTKKVWKLVDWTDPTRRDRTGEVDGEGDNDADAIKDCLEKWDSVGNRYPDGQITYEIKIKEIGLDAAGKFQTNGKTKWDWASDALGYLAIGGMIVVGVAALLVFPAASHIATAALWTTVLSSTAAASINIYQRHREKVGSWRDDVFDALTIVGSLLGGVGSTAGTIAKGAGWARGASLRVRLASGQIARVTLIGQVANDSIQGVLVSAEALKQYNEIMDNKDLSPEQRVQKLMAWVRAFATGTAMTCVSLRFTKNDLDNLKKQLKHDLPQARRKDFEVQASGDKLKQLGDPKSPEIDLTRPPASQGTTGQKKIKVKADKNFKPPPQKDYWKARLESEIPKDKWWVEHEFNHKKGEIHLKEPGPDGFEFHAYVNKGDLSITIKTRAVVGQYANGDPIVKRAERLWASKLYPLMFNYFERFGHKIKRFVGQFTGDNYESLLPRLRQGVHPGDLILDAITARKYWIPWADKNGFRLEVVKKKCHWVQENAAELIRKEDENVSFVVLVHPK